MTDKPQELDEILDIVLIGMNCTKPFTPRVADVKRGWGKFCSKSCKAQWQTNTQDLRL